MNFKRYGHSFAAYDAILTGRCRNRRKLANNTYAIRMDTCIMIRYHDTDIIEYFPNGMIRMRTGGWSTYSTKERLNSFTPFAIWSNRRKWWISGGGLSRKIRFSDNLVILNGKVVEENKAYRVESDPRPYNYRYGSDRIIHCPKLKENGVRCGLFVHENWGTEDRITCARHGEFSLITEKLGEDYL